MKFIFYLLNKNKYKIKDMSESKLYKISAKYKKSVYQEEKYINYLSNGKKVIFEKTTFSFKILPTHVQNEPQIVSHTPERPPENSLKN